MYTAVLSLASLTLLATSTCAHPTSPLALAVAIQQFSNAKIVPDVLPTFAPTGTMNLNYTAKNLKTQMGDALNSSITGTKPQNVYMHGTAAAIATAGGPYNVTSHKYTVMLFDGDVPGFSNKLGTYNLHWLANDWTYGVDNDRTVTLNPPAKEVIAYAAPGPAAGSGPHRYIALTFVQPENFTAPATPAKGSGVAVLNVLQYIKDANLGDAIAGTYFAQQDGAATAAFASTAAVDSTTLPQFTPTTASSAGASGTGKPNGAVRMGVQLGVGAFALLGALLSL